MRPSTHKPAAALLLLSAIALGAWADPSAVSAQTKTIACNPHGSAPPDSQARRELEVVLGEDGTRQTAVSVVRPTDDGGLVVLKARWIESPPSMSAARKWLAALNGLPSQTLWFAQRLLWWRHS